MARRGENIYKRKDARWEGRYVKGTDQSDKAIYSSVNITLNRYVHLSMEIKRKNMEKLYSYSSLSPSQI